MALLPSLLVSGLSPSAFIATGLWFFPFLIASISYYHYNDHNPELKVRDSEKLLKSYDFIIVGAGSAGSVIANRLSENPHWKILLLEAGGDETEISDVPALAAYLQLGRMDWKYKTEPQPGRACLGHTDQRCNWPRGKVLGGSSVLNYMLYVRGNRKDYDDWEAAGNPGWGYEDVLHYFKKSEDNRNPYLAATRYHSTGGYLTVQEAPWRTPLSTAFVEAGVEMGYDNRDGNGEYQSGSENTVSGSIVILFPLVSGFMIPQGTIRRGSRCSTAKAFLRPVRQRPNLHISMNSQVVLRLFPDDIILFPAAGVEAVDRQQEQVSVRGEVEEGGLGVHGAGQEGGDLVRGNIELSSVAHALRYVNDDQQLLLKLTMFLDKLISPPC